MQGSGKSSASIWTAFDSHTTSNVRKIKGAVWIAWTRIANVDNFATVGTSLVGGTDIIQGVGENAINNADSFQYFDESDRVIRIEYERNLIEPLGGMHLAMADVVLDNTDLRFTPSVNSTIGTAIRPNRPLKLFVGFHVQGQDKLIAIMEGLTLQPREDKINRTITISGYDYLQFLNTFPLESVIYTNQRSDQIIANILSDAGIGDSAYQLDTGINTVGFAWFEKGQTAGERIRKICEAEEGIFYQDETGKLRFENRDKYSVAPFNASIWTIEPDDILEWLGSENSQIINRAIVKGKPRSAKAETEIWRDGIEEQVAGGGGTLTIFASFEDPVTGITAPDANTDYTAFTATAGGGSDITADISIVVTTFTKSAKLVITNNNASAAFINLLKLRGTPATVDYTIKEVFQDTNSKDDYNEQQVEIDNEFIDSAAFAANMAQDIVRRHKNPNDVIRLRVAGIPQIQLRDQMRVKDQDTGNYTNYRLIGIQGTLEPGSFTQILRLRKITSNESL